MVDFTVGFTPTETDQGVCEELVEEIPTALDNLISGATERGIERGLATVKTPNTWHLSAIADGQEQQISGDIMRRLKRQALEKAKDDPTPKSVYVMHTHPSGLAGMSFYDVLAAIGGLRTQPQTTGNFVISRYQGKTKINGLVAKDGPRADRESVEVIEAVDKAKTMKQLVEEADKSPAEAKNELLPFIDQTFDHCSHITEL